MKVTVSPTPGIPHEITTALLVKIKLATDNEHVCYIYGIATSINHNRYNVRITPLKLDGNVDLTKISIELYVSMWVQFTSIELLPPNQQIILSN